MFILVDIPSFKILDILQTAEIINNERVKLPNDGYVQLNQVSVFEVESVPDNAKYYKDGNFSKRHPNDIKKDEKEIQEQLNELDKKSIRDTEDILDILITKGVLKLDDVPFVRQRKQLKKELRQQLKNLG
jgi:hypothetical protein